MTIFIGTPRLYLTHLAVLLWWLLDKTPRQRATRALVALIAQLLPSAALTLRLPSIRRFVLAIDALIQEGLFGSPMEGETHIGHSRLAAGPPILDA